jgi:thioesterase domain-containing protein
VVLRGECRRRPGRGDEGGGRGAERAAALDPVFARRANVERATVAAVRRYAPRHFHGRLNLFLPGREWLDSGVAALRWHSLVRRARDYRGPEASDGADMLREAHAAAFAELFRRACKEWE